MLFFPDEIKDMTIGEATQFVRRWNREYRRHGRFIKDYRRPMVVDGITFRQVGHNASHDFYAGLGKDGKCYKGAFSYEDNPQMKIIEVENFSGYFGHY